MLWTLFGLALLAALWLSRLPTPLALFLLGLCVLLVR